MKINRTELQKALEIVKPGLSNRELITQSTSFAFIKGRVITYNDEISISHPVPDLKITGAIKAEEFYQLLTKVKEEEIDVVLQESEILLKAGRIKAGITLQQEILLPLEEIGDISDWKALPLNFSTQLKFIIPATSNDMSKPLLTCIYVKQEGFLQATDNYRLMECKLDKKIPGESFLLPAASASQIVKLEPSYLAYSSGWVHFKTKEGTIISCRIFEDPYPEISTFLEVQGIKLEFPKILREALERADVFTKRQYYLDSEIIISIKENRLFVKGQSDSGWFEEEINMKYTGESIEFRITPMFLKDMLSQTNIGILGKSKIKFSTEDWQYVALLKVIKK